MAKESFDKEIQFLRMLVLTSGAYNRKQFAERLGISVHTFDKTLKKLKEVVSTVYQQLPEEQGQEFAESLRFNYYGSAEPMLLFLFRAKSLKDSESQRIARLLSALHEQPLTAKELLDICCSDEISDVSFPDEKTIRGDLKYLAEVGVIRKEPGPRPFRYRLENDLVHALSDDELLDLFDFVDVMSNTQLPSIQGYLLRDGLRKQLSRKAEGDESLEPFLYKYHYYSRILDEAHLFPLLSAIRYRRKVEFLYFSPRMDQSYASKNTNPLFARETEGKQETALPLKVVYDHQYGRWYLLAWHSRSDIRKYRLEGMTQLEEAEVVSEDFFEKKRQLLEDRIRYSWLIDTGRPVTIQCRFMNPQADGAAHNFVKERVLQQGQWGRIVEEDELSFVFEITVNGTTEIRPWLRSFGSSCEVLSPAKLRQEMIQEWKEIAAYYESF
ncbi:WYL domain-containing protein [Paenibacillus albidus]|uniref:helix-turn-helix transcriptional regulator n=1 Tax=Paenibacillus albidus TaxID=2041023 RepID=UPI001BEA9550|nr:WYL domain-containing protein [Paenibacillus albidus]MBT2289636.1 WYL domain-containing protein [Paenibacillus albidus]